MKNPDTARYIDFITARYHRLGYAPYRWFKAESEPPWTSLAKPLSQARVGVLTTAGAYVAGQVAFHYKDDTSLRNIPKSTPTAHLRFAHITENYLVNPRKDPNCVLPIEALRALEDEGEIGALADDLWSCMGGIYSQRRVREELAPEVLTRCREQAVDAALLIPM